MIYTTYFAKLKSLPENVIPISICGKAPDWYKGLQYKKLAPKYSFFIEWKKNHDNEYYIEHFNKEVLSNLSQLKVLTDIQCMLPENIKEDMDCPFYSSEKYHVALVCYEKPGDFCHRHLVADWLKNSGFWCEEWSFKNEKN